MRVSFRNNKLTHQNYLNIVIDYVHISYEIIKS
jgi:hypothetical protein